MFSPKIAYRRGVVLLEEVGGDRAEAPKGMYLFLDEVPWLISQGRAIAPIGWDWMDVPLRSPG